MDVSVESNTDSSLYVGVMGPGWSDMTTAFNKAGCWSLQADGHFYNNGSSNSTSARLSSGTRLTLVVDMDARSVEFVVKDRSVKTCQLPAGVGRVRLAACFGGSNQRLRIVDGGYLLATVLVCWPVLIRPNRALCCPFMLRRLCALGRGVAATKKT